MMYQILIHPFLLLLLLKCMPIQQFFGHQHINYLLNIYTVYLPMLYSGQASRPLADIYVILPYMYWFSYPHYCIYHHNVPTNTHWHIIHIILPPQYARIYDSDRYPYQTPYPRLSTTGWINTNYFDILNTLKYIYIDFKFALCLYLCCIQFWSTPSSSLNQNACSCISSSKFILKMILWPFLWYIYLTYI